MALNTLAAAILGTIVGFSIGLLTGSPIAAGITAFTTAAIFMATK